MHQQTATHPVDLEYGPIRITHLRRPAPQPLGTTIDLTRDLAAELAGLRAWRDAPHRMAARLITAPSAAGKTTLAHTAAAAWRSEGWLTIEATCAASRPAGAGQALAGQPDTEPAVDDPAEGLETGILVIVDEAQWWPESLLRTLLGAGWLYGTVPVRVILLTRERGYWWPLTERTLTGLGLVTDAVVLGGPADPDPTTGGPPAAGSREGHADPDPLAVTRALIGQTGPLPPTYAAWLLTRLGIAPDDLTSERLVDEYAREHPGDGALLAPPPTRVVEWLIGHPPAGAPTPARLAEALTELADTADLTDAAELADTAALVDGARVYQLRVLARARLRWPDRLGPILGELITDPPALLETDETLGTVLVELADPGLLQELINSLNLAPADELRANELMVALATNHADRADSLRELVHELIECDLPADALAVAGQWVAHCRTWLAETNRRIARIALATALVSLSEQLDAQQRCSEAIRPAEEAVQLARLARRLAGSAELARYGSRSDTDLGRLLSTTVAALAARALPPGDTEAAVRARVVLAEQLSRTDPEHYLPVLIQELTTLAGVLTDAGQPAAGCQVAEQVVTHYRTMVTDSGEHPVLVGRDLADHLLDLAEAAAANPIDLGRPAVREAVTVLADCADLPSSASFLDALNRASDLAAQLGDPATASRATEVTIGLHQRWSRPADNAELLRLTYLLAERGRQLSRAGRLAEAHSVDAAALAMLRERAASVGEPVPADWRATLATQLYRVAADLGDLDFRRHRKAFLALGREALELHRSLAAEAGHTHSSPYDQEGHARVASQLCSWLAGSKRTVSEAVTVGRESLAIRRQLFAEDPQTYRAALARVLYHLSSAYKTLGSRKAVKYRNRSVKLDRVLAQDDPKQHAHRWAKNAVNAVHLMNEQHRYARAEPLARQWLATCRRFADSGVRRLDAQYALLLWNYATTLAGLGRHSEALATMLEVTERYRKLAGDGRQVGRLLSTLDELSDELSARSRLVEGLTVAQECLAIAEQSAGSGKARDRSRIAEAHYRVSCRLGELHRHLEAAESGRRTLALARPGRDDWLIAAAQDSLGGYLAELGELDEGLALITTAVKRYRKLARDDPDYRVDLGIALANRARWRLEAGRPKAALADADQARALYAGIDPQDLDQHFRAEPARVGWLGAAARLGLGDRAGARALASWAVDQLGTVVVEAGPGTPATGAPVALRYAAELTWAQIVLAGCTELTGCSSSSPLGVD